MTGIKLRIIHETNPRKYFPALLELAKDGRVELVGIHRYSVVKECFRAWLRDRAPFWICVRNAFLDLLFRLYIPFVKNETIVMGFAPWDWRLLIYRKLVARNRILYHTSWHNWGLDNTPRQPKPRWFKCYMQKRWHDFVTHPNVKVIAVTSVVAASVKKEVGLEASVIPHAVPEVFFQAGNNRLPRKSLSLKLLYVGEVSEKKGINVLVDIMKQLPDNKFSLTIIGNGPLVNKVKTGAKNIIYLGPIYDRSKLAKIMAEHDVLMLLSQKTSSWEELFGIVIVEAIATGCAVIASDHIGPRGILTDVGGCGLFNEKDLEGVLKLVSNMAEDDFVVEELIGTQDVAKAYSTEFIREQWYRELTIV
jgi:glycosyltransferase involved in cell wall biosynthesis